MSWILREGYRKVIFAELFTLPLLGVCSQGQKSPFWTMRRSSADPPRIAISFEIASAVANPHYQTSLLILTFSIEYP